MSHIKLLGLTCASIAEAEERLDKKTDLAAFLSKHKRFASAWERGRFLRNLKALASAAVTVNEAADKLGMATAQELYDMLDTDIEVADTWSQARQEAFIRIKFGLIKLANEGNQSAIRAVEPFLRDESKQQQEERINYSHVTTNQLAQISGRTRQTVHNWKTQHGLPCNDDNTYDLRRFIFWFEQFTVSKFDNEKGEEKLDALRRAKANRLEMEIMKHRGQLLDREEVMAGLLARHQIFILWAEHRIDELARLCQGQKTERIAEFIKQSVGELRKELCQIPKEIRLSKEASETFKNLLEGLSKEK